MEHLYSHRETRCMQVCVTLCVCAEARQEERSDGGKKEKRENREQFAFTASLFKFSPSSGRL